MTTVERREAQRQSHLARAALARLRRRADRKVRLTGVSQAPRRLPRLHRLRASARSTSQLGRTKLRREIAWACDLEGGHACDVIPAKAGIHNHRMNFLIREEPPRLFASTGKPGVWVPAFAGTTTQVRLWIATAFSQSARRNSRRHVLRDRAAEFSRSARRCCIRSA